MKPIDDDELVLYHYRDGLAPERLRAIESALAASGELRGRLAAIRDALAEVDALPPVAVDADLGARVWRRLEPRLADAGVLGKRPTWRERLRALEAWLAPPRLGWAAACAVALLVGVSFYAGRHSATPPAPTNADAAAARVLDAYVAAHLRETEGVLLTASNGAGGSLEQGNRELAASLVDTNRLYAIAAARAGNAPLADFLRQLEPVLLSLANGAGSAPVSSSDGLQDYLRTTDLLFQVRATEAKLQREQRTRLPTETTRS